MASSLPGFDPDDLLDLRIPDRMREIFLCAKVAEFAECQGYKHTATLQVAGLIRLELSVRSIGFAILDGGLIMCRQLLDFLGIYYHQKSDALQQRTAGRRRPGDVFLIDDVSSSGNTFNNVTLLEAFANPWVPDTKMEAVLTNAMRHTNKAVGHLTHTPGRNLPLSQVKLTCEQVLHLVNLHLFCALQRAPVKFDEGVTIHWA